MQTGYIIWSRREIKQMNQGVFFTKKDAKLFIERMQGHSTNEEFSDDFDILEVKFI